MSNYLASEEAPASEAPQETTKKRSGALRETIETMILALIIFFGVRQLVLNFQVDGHSMDPNLDNGEMLLVNRHAYETYNLSSLVNWLPFIELDEHTITPFGAVERGDIVVFDPPNDDKPYIKRIIGLPGDEVTFNNGQVFVNGHMLEEDYIEDRTRCQRNDFCDVIVPEGGENRVAMEMIVSRIHAVLMG